MSLRGWITETDGIARFNAEGLPTELTVRGVSPDGDAAETLRVGADGRARWQATADKRRGGDDRLLRRQWRAAGPPRPAA
jgi:hypothetical protein